MLCLSKINKKFFYILINHNKFKIQIQIQPNNKALIVKYGLLHLKKYRLLSLLIPPLNIFPINLDNNALFSNPNNKENRILITDVKPSDKISAVTTAKNSYRGSKLITSIDQFMVNSPDLVSEKCGNINEIYNLLTPPLGKGQQINII